METACDYPEINSVRLRQERIWKAESTNARMKNHLHHICHIKVSALWQKNGEAKRKQERNKVPFWLLR